MTLERRLSPEEEELRVKQAELDGLVDQLSQKELDLDTLHAEINAFFRIYNAAIYPKFAAAQDLRARIAQAIFVLDPTDDTRSESEEARSSADEAERDRQEHPQPPKEDQPGQQESFTPSAELRALYRDLIKKAHPDLGKDDEDKSRRHELMVRVNRAYEEGDFVALQALADEWATGAGGPEGESVGEQLVRLIRQIFDVRSRLVSVDAEIDSVRASDDYGLLQQAEEARLEGRDLTTEHVARMDEHIEDLRSKIEDIKEQLQAV